MNIKITDRPIEEVDQTTFLGLNIDSSLSWSSHVERFLTKMSSGLYALRTLRKFCDLTTLKTVYHGLIHSHLAYNIGIYGATSGKNLNKILKLQK